MRRETRRTGTVSRRAFLLTAGAATGALALPGLTARAALAQGDKYGGLLRVSVTFGLSTINPVMHISGAEWTATKWMYNNLTRLNAKREPVPDLAESWSAGDGARVWTFKLRQGVRFHHGRELAAEDVFGVPGHRGRAERARRRARGARRHEGPRLAGVRDGPLQAEGVRPG